MASKLTQIGKTVDLLKRDGSSQSIVGKIKIICTNSKNEPLESRDE
jgi:hypothetical protein